MAAASPVAAFQSGLFRMELAHYFAEKSPLINTFATAVFNGAVLAMKRGCPEKEQALEEKKERVWHAISPNLKGSISLVLQVSICEGTLSCFSKDQLYSTLNDLFQSRKLSATRLEDDRLKEALANARSKDPQLQIVSSSIEAMDSAVKQKNQENYKVLDLTLKTEVHAKALFTKIALGFEAEGIKLRR